MKIKLLLAILLTSITFQTNPAAYAAVPIDTKHIKSEYECMAQALHYEARGESKAGIHAVANVIVNRSNHRKFPNTICGTVKQKTKETCQFSWYCDSERKRISTRRIDLKIQEIAYQAVINKKLKDITGGALFFHNDSFGGWSNLRRTKQIGNHVFYSY